MAVDRIRDVRERLARFGPPWTRDRERDFSTVTLATAECDILRDLLIADRASTVVEIGLAYGSSALAIGEALMAAESPNHVVIDPFQESAWANVGWDLLHSAGLEPIVRLMREPSSVALPQLVGEGLVADAAFVDGSHRFHEVFVDLYYLRKIVRSGGLVIVDEDGADSVRTALRYYEENLGWSAVPFSNGTVGSRCRAFRLPDVAFEPPFEAFRPF